MFKLKPLAALTLLGTMLSAQTVLAQEEALESTTIEAVAEESAEANLGPVEEIVVTGSRLRSSTYTSISPLQIIDAEFQREVGLINADEILQNSTNAGGQQIDLSFNGFVLDNGPGSSTVSLRGLGANRTLLLMNGRRLSPSGVEGAPSSPSVNLVPRLMIQRYENLLDAASSIYGSDAIAGATNIITKKDFDGLQLEVFSGQYDRAGGDNATIGAAWGFNTERARSVLVSSTLTSTVRDTQTVHGLTSVRVTLRSRRAVKFADRISTTKTSAIPTWVSALLFP
jgi:iron complex outermembrane receptor protein